MPRPDPVAAPRQLGDRAAAPPELGGRAAAPPGLDDRANEPAGAGHGSERTERTERRDRALDVLLDPALAHIVDFVAYPDRDDIVVAATRGTVRYLRTDPDVPARLTRGHHPFEVTDTLNEASYPFAGRRLVSLFAEPARAPDLAVVHTGAHYWPERGGTLGEHGSLSAVQSRAPLILSGPGVRARGVLDRTARTVDVAATLCQLTGASYDGMDGAPLADLVAPGAAHVVGLLWDGAQCADLLALASDGRLPAVARLLESGCALRGGAIAEFPSVTLVNHTCALTGVGPGRHGIVNNAYFDRELGQRVVTNDASSWHHACEWLRPGVQTVFERVGERGFTACVNEPIDRGASYSTFGLIRASGGSDAGGTGGVTALRGRLPDPTTDPHATQAYVAAEDDYAWWTQVDAAGLLQMRQLWDGAANPTPPYLTWWNTPLTDSGHHLGGPGSPIARAALADADRRLGTWLDLVDSRGLREDTVVVLTADHGSQAADPDCRGDWDEALRAAGVAFRDEAYGFVYLG